MVNPSSVMVIGSTDTDVMDFSSTSAVKATTKASGQPSSSEFAEFKDQLSSAFTRVETVSASVAALPPFYQKPMFSPVRAGVTHPNPIWAVSTMP